MTVTHTDRWWKAPKNSVHDALKTDITTLQNKLQYRADQNLKYMQLYSNQNIQSLQGDGYDQPDPFDDDRLVLNVIQSVVNAVTAKISTNRPRCMPLTVEATGSFRNKRRIWENSSTDRSTTPRFTVIVG